MTTITTTSGSLFTYEESRALAQLVFRRFGEDIQAATAAWNRLLQNNCDEGSFKMLLDNTAPEVDPTARYAVMMADGNIVATGDTIRQASHRADLVAPRCSGWIVHRDDPSQPWKNL